MDIQDAYDLNQRDQTQLNSDQRAVLQMLDICYNSLSDDNQHETIQFLQAIFDNLITN
ncbi:MAG: hypothetical protein N4A72_22105 [Bacteroidales bacterium]|jgi:hypothetical protein|nr:hypothetical protein [Bacteroidales bacterium]